MTLREAIQDSSDVDAILNLIADYVENLPDARVYDPVDQVAIGTIPAKRTVDLMKLFRDLAAP